MFYVLLPETETDAEIVYGLINGGGNQLWKINRCSTCGQIISEVQLRNLSFDLYGYIIKDFIWTDDDVLISSEFAEKLRTSQLTGFTLRETDIVFWWRLDPSRNETVNWLEHESPPTLYQLSVTGKGGSIIPRNAVRIRSTCSVCGHVRIEPPRKGIIIDADQWDGSDFFKVNELGYIFVSEKCLMWLKNHGINNYSAVPSNIFSSQRA